MCALHPINKKLSLSASPGLTPTIFFSLLMESPLTCASSCPDLLYESLMGPKLMGFNVLITSTSLESLLFCFAGFMSLSASYHFISF